VGAAQLRHDRHYTLAQANAARPWVAQRLERMRAAIAELGHADAQQALAQIETDVGGAFPGRPVARALLELHKALGELQEMEIVMRDVERGLVDFPSLRDGNEVYLCWLESEEDEIGWWHEPEAGFAGRQPL
jgi:hypothetical protein